MTDHLKRGCGLVTRETRVQFPVVELCTRPIGVWLPVAVAAILVLKGFDILRRQCSQSLTFANLARLMQRQATYYIRASIAQR